MGRVKFLCFVVVYIVLQIDIRRTLAAEANPPVWPSTVGVFGPDTSVADIQGAVNKAFALNGGHSPDNHGQFSNLRFAFLFKPGKYNVEVPVAYYTQVLGLGELPSDVVFTSAKGVYSDEGSYSNNPGSLNDFWRGAENFQTDADFKWVPEGGGMLWAASQAAPLRRISVTNDVILYRYRSDGGGNAADFASGGYLANSEVKGSVLSGSQQQYLTRNTKVGGWTNGVWNMVFVGTEGAPASHCGANSKMCVSPFVTVDEAPIIAEKPFISFKDGKYNLNIPNVATNRKSFEWSSYKQVGFENVYVAVAGKDTATTINAKLSEGCHVVCSPGIYSLSEPLELNKTDQVLLGLGLATLVAAEGQPAVKVGNVDGVRVAGLLLEAGSKPTEVLLQWGDGSHKGSETNPGVLQDIFARVGGPSEPAYSHAKVMVEINTGHVIGDDLWLWRADHTVAGLVYNGDNPSEVALIVNGDDVTMYGLATEHTLQDLVQWNGDRGKTYFFQGEMPYDVTQENYGDKGYVGYRVNSKVTEHAAFGLGVYHYFRDDAVAVNSGISVPSHLENSIEAPFTVYLNGLGIIQHVMNDKGVSTSGTSGGPAVPEWYCSSTTSSQKPDFMFSSVGAACKVGDSVTCPGTSLGCAGNSCCSDGSTCPSADHEFSCCAHPKKEDCTAPGPGPSPGLSPGPSPSPTGCAKGKDSDCTKKSIWEVVV